MLTLLSIAFGGALGAVLRHGVNVATVQWFGHGFPYGTLGVNIIGSFIMGVLIATFAHFWQPTPEVKAFLITGLLGAFTTFSTFSLDFVTLYERGDIIQSVSYLLMSVIGAILALFAGLYLVRGLAG